jgi:hypothetical protein
MLPSKPGWPIWSAYRRATSNPAARGRGACSSRRSQSTPAGEFVPNRRQNSPDGARATPCSRGKLAGSSPPASLASINSLDQAAILACDQACLCRKFSRRKVCCACAGAISRQGI